VDDFYGRLAEKLEQETLRAGDVLRDFPEWDSLTVLSVVAMIDEAYGVNLGAEDLVAVETAGDLEALVRARRHSHG
jgi:acyl carrier protein